MWFGKPFIFLSQLFLLAVSSIASYSLSNDPNVEIVFIKPGSIKDLEIQSNDDEFILVTNDSSSIEDIKEQREEGLSTDPGSEYINPDDIASELANPCNDSNQVDKRIRGSSNVSILSAESANIGTFSPLDCNPSSWDDCSILLSDNLPSGSDPLTIPCGKCYTFDLDGDVTLNGLNIEGKLLFPLNHQAVISTPYIIVQGELELTVDHAKVNPDNMGTKFILTGTSNVYFKPTKAPNQNVCPNGGQCNLGVKPFIVAGGKVNINAMPENCASHTPIMKKVYTDPVYNSSYFPQFVELPDECPQSGLSFISYNFDDGDFGNWTGRDGAFMEVMNDGSVKVTNRRIRDRGPHLDITALRPDLCLVPDQDYLFVARIKLDRADGTMVGEDSTCKATGSYCPELRVIHYDVDVRDERSRRKTNFHETRNRAPVYGEYFWFTGIVTFDAEELNPRNAFYTLRIQGPEEGIDITVDSFDLSLPDRASYPDPNELCQELILNGDAEANGFHPYPMWNSRDNQQLIKAEEDGNKFWRLFDRNHHRSSMKTNINTLCLIQGVTYLLSSKVRLHHSEGFVGGSEPYIWFIYFRRADGRWIERNVVECDAQSASDGWVTCLGDFVIEPDMAGATEAYLETKLKNDRDGEKYDIDFDDISIRYYKGYVSELVVDSQDVSCWGNETDVHVTTSTYYNSNWDGRKPPGFVSLINDVVDNGDGTSTLLLNESATLPIISAEENSDYAAELVLLSRNVIIKGDDGEKNKGGYMQIIHTPNVAQIIQGVEFQNMGRRKEVDKYALQFLYSSNVEGTLVSRNSFRQSNQRCVVIEGTSNVTVSHNVAHETDGHCMYVGYESNYNLITKNLVSDTKYIGWNDRLDGEDDYDACAFRNLYNPNDYVSNIAVAGPSRGFCVTNHWQTRLENGKYVYPSPKEIKMGTFEDNTAKSFWNLGFYFSNQESNEESVISGLKAIKNRVTGIYISYSYDMTILNSLVAENAEYDIDVRWVDNLQIQDTTIIGYTSETKAIVKPPDFRKPCVSSSFSNPPTGFRLPTQIRYWNREDGDKIGAILTNVQFTNFDHSDECAASFPIRFRNDENRYNHFEYTSMFRNVTIDGKKIMDALTSDNEGVKDIAIHDLDGSTDPLGQATHGMLVSNVKSLTAFANNTCHRYPDGASYCAELCYRTVSFFVDQTDSDQMDLRVTRKSDGRKAIVPFATYEYEDDSHRKNYYDNYRLFSVSLPEGSYQLEFLKDLQPVWPTFLMPRWEGTPQCQGYVSEENITVVEPLGSCDELIKNGDMEKGVYHWYHRNGGDTDNGALLAENEGINGSTAIRNIKRNSLYHGIGQNLDTRCFHQNLNEFYEIQLYFRLENNNSSFICDPFDDSEYVRCPYITFRQDTYINQQLDTRYRGRKAQVVVPNDNDGFNIIHGVFKVDEEIISVERLHMYLEIAHKDHDMIIDNASVKKLPGVCKGDFIRNGKFDEYSKFWEKDGYSPFSIEENSIKIYNRQYYWEGTKQQLYIEKGCLQPKQRYHVTAKFKLEVASSGAPFRCDRTAYNEPQCAYGLMRAEGDYGSEERPCSFPIAVAPHLYDGWDVLSGIWTVTEKQFLHEKLYFRLRGPHETKNVFYDDVKITPLVHSCSNLVLNGDFETGDTRFWEVGHREYIDMDISSIGASESSYSLMTKKYTSYQIRQDLDTRCILEDQEFLISAKFRLLNATDQGSGVQCSPSIKNRSDRNHCPTVAIYGRECAGDDVRFYFFNEIDQFQWDPNGFNDFRKVFPITLDLTTCNIVRVEVGHNVHDGRILLVDDIQITQRTTSPPTNSPTFAPTKGKEIGPTNQPTIRTDAPTTTNVITCPLVGDAPLSVGSGAVILSLSNDGSLCTLTKSVTSDASDNTVLIPIARSYDNKPWEQAAGDQAAIILSGKDILCYDVGCQLELKAHGPGEEYLLSSSSHSLSESNEYARFLETATFGITQAELDSFLASPNSVQDNIINWISTQMNVSETPISSHREFWRKGVNPRMPTSTSIGTSDHPCDKFSRWRKMSFVRNDNAWHLTKKLRITDLGSGNSGPFKLELNRWIRTIADTLEIENDGYENYVFDPTFEYELCNNPEDNVSNGRLWIRLEPVNGGEQGPCVTIRNPLVNLDGYEYLVSNILNLVDDDLKPIDLKWTSDEELVLQLQTSLHENLAFSSICANLPAIPEIDDEPTFGKLSDGTWLIFDPRLDLLSNTLDLPQDDGGKDNFKASGGDTYCSNVPRTFLNEDQCQVSSDACRPSSNSQVDILLDNNTIAALNNLTDRYTYAIKGLKVKYEGIVLHHPCTPGLRSRWVPKNITECNPTDLYGNTTASLTELLSESGDRNTYIRDINFPEEGLICEASDTEPEIEMEVDGVCWKRVHDEYLSIFDMTYWVSRHPGGAYNIKKWSENNGTVLVYPSDLKGKEHGMSRWNNNWQKFTYVGRFGDSLRLGDLPNNLRTEEVINYFDPPEDGDDSKILVCGSPGEVSNNRDDGFVFDVDNGYATVNWNNGNNRKYVWIMIALGATDQLRQRIAWALAQILVVVKDAIGDEGGKTEWFVSYYDIFVRNAFGNYRKVLKEVSYNPLMAENLSFLGSKSSAYMLERYRIQTSADENYAREIMQLFSMGLELLNMDGSPKLDSNGNTILSYTNDDIMSFSRAWTGFDLQPRRGNMEGWDNRIDPMKIVPEWRDRFPKSHTTGGYIGDAYPVCYDAPSRPFLRIGATYRFLGSSKLPELMTDPADFATRDNIVRVVLDDSSELRNVLCNEDNTGTCAYKNSITLSTNYNCIGIECEVETLRVVQVDTNVFYEYVPAPCVNLVFYNNPVKISPRYSTDKVMCADPRLPVASEACCSLGNQYATRNSRYSGERLTFNTAEARCKVVSKRVCDYYRVDGDSYLNAGYFWTSKSCLLQVKIKRDGSVAIVHRPSDFLERVAHVADDSHNYFRVFWSREGDFPNVDNDCDNVCQVLAEGSCLCNTGVIERAVFNSMPLSKAEAMEKLTIGAFDPLSFDSNMYFSVFDESTNITAYLKGNEFNTDTIFEFDDENGRSFLVKNIDSSVYLRGIESGYTGQSFRNPPQFMSFIPAETNLRDAQYETEATLDHYFYHDNTAPFLATRLIQRLITSNPTPLYIKTVANAFKSGTYTKGGTSFGSGKYGDLASTFAAIYLDDAARNILLDEDIFSGSLREPILKVMAAMRSMEFASKFPVPVVNDLFSTIGQMAHEFTTVFSFFLPEFTPYGRVGDASLVSPEATLLDMPKMIGLMNGLTSLAKFGLSDCEGGWGGRRWCSEHIYSQSIDGVLEFNKTETGFSYETFEGPSLNGGFDNTWIGRYFNENYGVATVDPLDNINHVVHFPRTSWTGEFYSEPIINKDQNGNPYVVKFRYLGNVANSGGCIGYYDSTQPYLNTQTWGLCDNYNNIMRGTGVWQSCQFLVPAEIESFHIVVGDVRSPGGDAYFDDIQLASGTETTCTGINVPKRDPIGQEDYSSAVVDKLSTLLTAGRLSNEAKAVITNAYDNAGSANDGLRVAQQLIFSSGEFHTTNIAKITDVPRDAVTFEEPSGQPYRAVVYLMLSGGCDSFNMLMPHTCDNGLYESYLDVRQQVAIPKNVQLPIDASNQVCSKFGLHPELKDIRNLYNEGDVLFFANTGVLSQPVNKDNYYILTNTQLFAHNHMQRETKRIDPYDTISGTGVLGRMSDILTRKGMNVGSFSVDRFSVALVGQPGVTDAPFIVDRNGVPNLFFDDILTDLDKLHNTSQTESGIFADTWSSFLMKSLGVNQLLRQGLENVEVNVPFPKTYLGYTLATVSKLIATKDLRGVDVDTFYVETGGYDTHASVEEALNDLFNQLNDAISSFSDEMKSRNLWANVTIIQTSDFARTLNPNGGDGTDHAWGGNYMMIGGSVNGSQIVGEYPDDITDEGPLTLGRGRMIPTTPWEVPFLAIARWLGIEDINDQLEVCPNLRNFDSISLADPESIISNVLDFPTSAPTSSLTPSTSPSTSPSKVQESGMPSSSLSPSTLASSSPSNLDSSEPSAIPTFMPSFTPTPPTKEPSLVQSYSPSMKSTMPSFAPTVEPTFTPTLKPTIAPTVEPTFTPTLKPTIAPTVQPTFTPTLKPTIAPTVEPTFTPTLKPTIAPTVQPTFTPTLKPTVAPTVEPTFTPTLKPTLKPTTMPTKKPSFVPSPAPTVTKEENVALGKPTSQSSSANNPSDNAVDGDLSTFSLTSVQNSPYWNVNLISVYEISAIKLYLDSKMLSKMKNIRVQIFNRSKKVHDYAYPGVPKTLTVVNISKTIIGDKVNIVLEGKNKQIKLQEVEVIATATSNKRNKRRIK